MNIALNPIRSSNLSIAIDKDEKISIIEKIKRIFELVIEIGIKEFFFTVICLKNFCLYPILSRRYNLNPPIQTTSKVYKAVILLHGQASAEYCMLPIAKVLYEKGIKNVFTVKLKQTSKNLVPIENLAKKIDTIVEKCLKKGINKVNFILIGHSLGAIVAAKYIWRSNYKNSEKVTKIISIAGRLKYQKNRFWWFCKERFEIAKTYFNYLKNPNKAVLCTIRGTNDQIVPKNSVHIQNNKNRQLNVENFGHGNIILSQKTHNQIIKWLSQSPLPKERGLIRED